MRRDVKTTRTCIVVTFSGDMEQIGMQPAIATFGALRSFRLPSQHGSGQPMLESGMFHSPSILTTYK